jgi:hypothetical protein
MKPQKPTAKPKPDDKEQSRLFIEMARETGADEDSSAADQVLGRLAKQQPELRKPSRKVGLTLGGLPKRFIGAALVKSHIL